MPDLDKMTLERLRALAAKALGPGHSRFKTKSDLVRALKKAGTGGGGPGKGAAKPKPKPKTKVKVEVRAAPGKGKAVASKAKAAGAKAAKAAPKRPARAKAAGPASGKGLPAAIPEGLDPDGYFVARVRGEEAVRDAPHPMTEGGAGAPPPVEEAREDKERLGDLPWSYGDDAFVALPRDPRTLFLYWDLSQETLAHGFEGLDRPRAQLWIFLRSSEGWGRLRTAEFALESRGFYVHDLEPGREYRAEIHAVDRHGRERMLARPSNDVALPPVGASPIVDDRFVRIPWDMPLGRVGAGHPGGPFSDEARALLARLSDWARLGGASSSAGGARPSSPSSSPSSPFGPFPGRDE